MRRLEWLVLVALAAGCGTVEPAPPWEGVDPASVSRVVCTRRDLADTGSEDELVLDQADRRRVADAIADAVEMNAQRAGPGVSGVRYTVDCTAPGAAWRLELETADVFSHRRGASVTPRYYRSARLRSALDAAWARWNADTSRDLASFVPRLERFLARCRARAVRDGVALELVGGARAGAAGRAPIDPRRLHLVTGDGRELMRLDLPAGTSVHPAYASLRILFGPDGRTSVAGAPDRNHPLDAADLERAQPFPLHFDLVLVEPDAARALYGDVRPDGISLRLR